MKIDIKKLAKLARIKLSETEEKELQKDTEAILGFVSKLKDLPGENKKEIIPEHRNVFRKDEPPASRKLIRLSENRTKNGFIKVKNIFERNG